MHSTTYSGSRFEMIPGDLKLNFENDHWNSVNLLSNPSNIPVLIRYGITRVIWMRFLVGVHSRFGPWLHQIWGVSIQHKVNHGIPLQRVSMHSSQPVRELLSCVCYYPVDIYYSVSSPTNKTCVFSRAHALLSMQRRRPACISAIFIANNVEVGTTRAVRMKKYDEAKQILRPVGPTYHSSSSDFARDRGNSYNVAMILLDHSLHKVLRHLKTSIFRSKLHSFSHKDKRKHWQPSFSQSIHPESRSNSFPWSLQRCWSAIQFFIWDDILSGRTFPEKALPNIEFVYFFI